MTCGLVGVAISELMPRGGPSSGPRALVLLPLHASYHLIQYWTLSIHCSSSIMGWQWWAGCIIHRVIWEIHHLTITCASQQKCRFHSTQRTQRRQWAQLTQKK